jgi:hypothetical protein
MSTATGPLPSVTTTPEVTSVGAEMNAVDQTTATLSCEELNAAVAVAKAMWLQSIDAIWLFYNFGNLCTSEYLAMWQNVAVAVGM